MLDLKHIEKIELQFDTLQKLEYGGNTIAATVTMKDGSTQTESFYYEVEKADASVGIFDDCYSVAFANSDDFIEDDGFIEMFVNALHVNREPDFEDWEHQSGDLMDFPTLSIDEIDEITESSASGDLLFEF